MADEDDFSRCEKHLLTYHGDWCPECQAERQRELAAFAMPKPDPDPNEIYLIWSNEHNAWWGPDRCGYSEGINGAGLYSRREAIAICREAFGTALHLNCIAEIPVRLIDINEMTKGGIVPNVIMKGKS